MAEHAWLVPSAAPVIEEQDIEAVLGVLSSGVLANGPEARALELEFAAYCESRYAIAVSSGTAALVLAGQALGLGRGDTVLVAGFTFAATANAFLSLGCEVVPVDVHPRTMNFDVGALESVLANCPDARAVVVVDLFGNTVGTDAVIATARDAGLSVIEDAAQAHGARTECGRRVGARADATTFSLYSTKNMAAGEGGLITTQRTDVAESVKHLRNHGGLEQYRHEVVGLNHRLPEMSAALARSQLSRLEVFNDVRMAQAATLAGLCRESWGELVTVPDEVGIASGQHIFHQFTIAFSGQEHRDRAARHLQRRGVETRHFYPYTISELPYVGGKPTPVADRLRDTVLSLPVHPGLRPDQWEVLREAIRSGSVPARRS